MFPETVYIVFAIFYKFMVKLMENEKTMYELEGQVMGGAMSAFIGLVLGVGIAVMLMIFVGVLAGTTYQVSEPQINLIENTTIQSSIKQAALKGFNTLEQTSNYMNLIVLALIIGVIFTIILGLAFVGNIGGGRGGGFAL